MKLRKYNTSIRKRTNNDNLYHHHLHLLHHSLWNVGGSSSELWRGAFRNDLPIRVGVVLFASLAIDELLPIFIRNISAKLWAFRSFGVLLLSRIVAKMSCISSLGRGSCCLGVLGCNSCNYISALRSFQSWCMC